MRNVSWLCKVVIAACLFMASGCASTGKDVNTTILPNQNGDGVRSQLEIEFGSITEVPKKLLAGLGLGLVSITQPIHPFHYVRNDQGEIINTSEGKPHRIWLPFWRIIGDHHGDSVVGIVYDHGWFRGWREKSGDKLGKSAGLLLLIWGADRLLDEVDDDGGSERCTDEYATVTESDTSQSGLTVPEEIPPDNPNQPPDIPPVQNPNPDPVLDWGDGEGGPVGM